MDRCRLVQVRVIGYYAAKGKNKGKNHNCSFNKNIERSKTLVKGKLTRTLIFMLLLQFCNRGNRVNHDMVDLLLFCNNIYHHDRTIFTRIFMKTSNFAMNLKTICSNDVYSFFRSDIVSKPKSQKRVSWFCSVLPVLNKQFSVLFSCRLD